MKRSFLNLGCRNRAIFIFLLLSLLLLSINNICSAFLLGNASDNTNSIPVMATSQNNPADSYGSYSTEPNLPQSYAPDSWEAALFNYLFPGKLESELNVTEESILQWERDRWIKLLSQDGFNPDMIKHMLQIRVELKPEVERFLYPEPLSAFNLPEWQRFSEEIERWVSMISGEYVFGGKGLEISEITANINLYGMNYIQEAETLELEYKAGGSLTFILNTGGKYLAQFDTIGFDIKKGSDAEGRLTGTTQFRVALVDENGKVIYNDLLRNVLVPGTSLSAISEDWQGVEIDLKGMLAGLTDEERSSIAGIQIMFKTSDMTSKRLLPGETAEGRMFFDNIRLVPSEQSVSRDQSQVEALLSEYVTRKASLEKQLGRPLIPTILEDRLMLENGKVNSWQEMESIVPFLSEYYGRTFDLKLSIDKGIYDYYANSGKSAEEIKKTLSEVIILRPYVENVIGKRDYSELLDASTGPEGFLETTLRGVCEFFKATRDSETGLFVDSGEASDKSIDLSSAATGFGLTAVTMAAAWGWIDQGEAREWTENALNTLLDIQSKQQKYEEELTAYLEERDSNANGTFITLGNLSGWARFNALEELRDKYECDFLIEKKYLSSEYDAELTAYKTKIGVTDLSSQQLIDFRRIFANKYSDISRYGRWGFFYRYFTRDTLERVAEDSYGNKVVNDLSTIDTAILVQGILTAGKYFGDLGYTELKEKADQIYRSIDWNKMLNPTQDSRLAGIFSMGWDADNLGGRGDFLKSNDPEHPETNHWYYYTDETILVNLLAMGSPTYAPIDVNGNYVNTFAAFKRTSPGNFGDGSFIESGTGSLFTYHMNIGIDLRNLKDTEGIVWPDNSIKATLFNRNYVKDNLTDKTDTFSPNSWPITTMLTDKGYNMATGPNPEAKIVGLSGYGGSIVHSLYSLLGLEYLAYAEPGIWTDKGFLDSYSNDIVYNREGKWLAPTQIGFSQGMFLQMFNVLGELSGAKGPSIWSLTEGIDYIQNAIAASGLTPIEEKTLDISDTATTSAFAMAFTSPTGGKDQLGKALIDGDVLSASAILSYILEEATTEGDFAEMRNFISSLVDGKYEASAEENVIATCLIAETYVAQVQNIASAATGEKYQDSRTFDAIKYFFEKSGSYYNEALNYLDVINDSITNAQESDLLKELRVIAKTLEYIICKNMFQYTKQKETFLEICDLIGDSSDMRDSSGFVSNLASLIYKYDYEGRLTGAITQAQIENDLKGVENGSERIHTYIYPSLEKALNENVILDPLLGTDAGLISGFQASLTKDLQKKYHRNFVISDKAIFQQINQEFNELIALKPYVENLLGRKIDFSSSGGTDTGFLKSWADEVKGGLVSGDFSMDPSVQGNVFQLIYFKNRAIKAFQRMTGHKFFDITDEKSQDNLWYNYYSTSFWSNIARSNSLPQGRIFDVWNPRDFIYRMQIDSGEGYPANYLVGTNISDSELSTDVAFNELPALRIDDSKEIMLRFQDLSSIDRMNLWVKGNENSGSFKIVIKNAKGEEAIFRVEGLDANWHQFMLPIWDNNVSFIDDASVPEWLKNSTWSRWGTLNKSDRGNVDEGYFWQRSSEQELQVKGKFTDNLRVYLEKDEITDWTKVVSISINKTDGQGPLYISGIYQQTDTWVNLNDLGMAGLTNYLNSGMAIIACSQEGVVVTKEGTNLPGQNPGRNRAGFTASLNNANLVLIGVNGNKIQFVVPEIGQNVLEADYDYFIENIWDGNQVRLLNLYGTKEYR